LILRWVLGAKLSDEDVAEIECLRAVAVATNFGTKIAINWLFLTIATRRYGGGFEWSADKMQILPSPAPKEPLPWQPLFGF